MDPILLIFLVSTGAAVVSAVGVLPLVGRSRVPQAWIGWSDALAGGMMLGLAYLLTTVAFDDLAGGGTGVFLGILFIFLTQAAIDDAAGRLQPPNTPSISTRQVFLQGSLHSASEGVAIAAAWATDTRFGLFMAFAVAVHNIPEGTLLASTARQRGLGLGRATGVVIAANLSQIIMAVATYALAIAAPATIAWVTGFAAGALVHLVMTELLPDSYRYAGATSIAVVTAVAMGVVVLGGGTLL